MAFFRGGDTRNEQWLWGGGIRIIVGFQPLMVISRTASWVRGCMQVYVWWFHNGYGLLSIYNNMYSNTPSASGLRASWRPNLTISEEGQWWPKARGRATIPSPSCVKFHVILHLYFRPILLFHDTSWMNPKFVPGTSSHIIHRAHF